MQQPRGIRNHNPGNIRHGQKWEGLAPEQPDKSFCTFTSPEYGIRALTRILYTYNDKYGLNTVRKIITRFAPATENDTESYITSVCSLLDVGASTPIDIRDHDIMVPLIKAIIRHENGRQPYTNEQIAAGINLAKR